MKKLKHPDAKGTIEVRPEYVDMYLSQGWVEVKETKPKTDSDKK